MQKEKINCWIQGADFSIDDLGEIDITSALDRYKTHNWENELARYKELIRTEADCCPPGIGFVATSRHILHICPNGDGTVMVHFHYPKPFLGFLWRVQVSESNPSLDESRVPGLLDVFYSGYYDQIRIAS